MKRTLSESINHYFQTEEYGKARALLIPKLRKAPKDHWLLTRIGTTYHEERNYKKALKYSEKAFKLEPHCPLVVWDYAGTLDMLAESEKAITLWKGLVARGIEGIAHGECGEGIRWAKSLLNDCYYRIGSGYFRLNNKEEAVKFIKKHLSLRQRGIPSTYSIKEVRRRLLKITIQ